MQTGQGSDPSVLYDYLAPGVAPVATDTPVPPVVGGNLCYKLTAGDVEVTVPDAVVTRLELLIVFRVRGAYNERAPVAIGGPLSIQVFLPVLRVGITEGEVVTDFTVSTN